jgi:hypothetical protein
MSGEIEELRAAYAAGAAAAKRGQSPDSQPYGRAVRGLTTKKITAWFIGFMDGQSAVRRCGTVAVA